MSLLLPDDNYERENGGRSAQKDKKPQGLLDRLKGLSTHPLFLKSTEESPDGHMEMPTSKIRIVTNSWIDRPKSKRSHE